MSQPTSFLLPRSDGELPVLRWRPGPGRENGAGIVLVQEIFGVTDYICSRAADLAGAGYTVDVPVLFFRETSQAVPDDDPDLLERGMALAAATDWTTAVADVNATAEHLSLDLSAAEHADDADSPAAPIALVGFCYGGGLAYAAAAADQASAAPTVTALVSYYGSALPTLDDLSVDLPSLHHFGTADSYIPMELVRTIQRRVTSVSAPVDFHLYEGAGHAFDNPLPTFHDAGASEQAWARTLEFLERALTA